MVWVFCHEESERSLSIFMHLRDFRQLSDSTYEGWIFQFLDIFSLKNLWKGGTILLMGLRFKGCTQKPVTFMDLLLSCHTHTGAQKHSQVSSINTCKCSECPNIDTRQRLNRVHFCYLCMHHLVVPKDTHFNNIWLSFKIFWFGQ